MRTVKAGHKTRLRMRTALATALMLWCAGAGCMMVSYARGAAMSTAEPQSTGWHMASGSAGSHECCKARHASQRRTASSKKSFSADFEEVGEVPNSSDAMSCCPLTSGTFVVSGRQTISNENGLAPQDASIRPLTGKVAAAFKALPSRLPNQDQTYLRDCVFLI